MAYSNKFFTVEFDELEYGKLKKLINRYCDILNKKTEFMKISQIHVVMDMAEEIQVLTIKGYMAPNCNAIETIRCNKDVVEYIECGKEALIKARLLKKEMTKKNNNEDKND